MWNLWNIIQILPPSLEYTNIEDGLIENKCLCCNKNYQQKYNETLKEQFSNTYRFSNLDKNKFILVLQKGVYSYEHMNDWGKFSETSLREKEEFYSHLNRDNISDADYTNAKRVCKDFEIKSLVEYHGFHVQNNTLLLVDAFGNFWNMFLEIYEINLAHFLSALGLSRQAASKKTTVKLDLLTDIDVKKKKKRY